MEMRTGPGKATCDAMLKALCFARLSTLLLLLLLLVGRQKLCQRWPRWWQPPRQQYWRRWRFAEECPTASHERTRVRVWERESDSAWGERGEQNNCLWVETDVIICTCWRKMEGGGKRGEGGERGGVNLRVSPKGHDVLCQSVGHENVG